MEKSISDMEIISALKDCGLCDKQINEFITTHNNNYSDGKILLSKYRANMLESVHAEQDKLYCIDFLIHKLYKT